MSLRSYIFLWLGAVSILAAGVLTAVESQRLKRVLLEESDETQRFAVAEMTDDAVRVLDANVRVQRTFAAAVEARLRALPRPPGAPPARSVEDLPVAELAAMLAEWRGSTSLYAAYIGNASGRSIVFDPPNGPDGKPLPPTDYSDRDYFQALVRKGDAVVSRAERGRRIPITTVYIGTPIWDSQRRLAGYVGCGLVASVFRRVTESVASRLPGTTVLLLDRQGAVIASSGADPFEPLTDLSHADLLRRTGPDAVTREGRAPGGGWVRAAAMSTEQIDLGWTAVVYTPTALLDGKIARARAGALLVTGVVLIAALGVAFVGAGWVARPIKRLAAVARAMGEGRFDVAIPPATFGAPVEVRGLSAAIVDAMHKLHAHALDRESRVKALSDSNALLSESLSALREAQEKLLQADRLAAVGQLAGGIAHDFNNLLTVILASAALLEEELPEDGPAAADAKQILKEAQRGANLTRQLLAFSRRQVLMPKLVDLNAVLADMEQMLRRLIGEDIRLTSSPCPGGARVVVDPVQIEQVLVNLVVNARDALPDGGHVSIAITRLSPAEAAAPGRPSAPDAGWVAVSVTDDGVGMTDDVSARVFEPFFTTKAPDKGTGLGLATVYGIVKQSGGEVTVTSAAGHGSTFRVLLPAAREEDAGSAHDRGPIVAPRAAGTVVVVEDEPAIRRVVGRILERAGYRVLLAGSPGDALAIADRHVEPIAVLLTDVVMPDLSGPRLAERFVAAHPETSVLFMSGYSSVAAGVTFEPEHFLQKPFKPADLVEKIALLVERSFERTKDRQKA